jgi:hypothetical protein
LYIPQPTSVDGLYADSLTWSPDGSNLAMLLHSNDRTYGEVLVSAVKTGEIIYQKQLDTTNK